MLFVLAIVTLLIIIGRGCKKEESTRKGLGILGTSKDSITVEEEREEKEEGNWQYSTTYDKMDDRTDYFARCVSTNEAEFEFPYQGGSRFIITIRNQGKDNDVMIYVTRGQFMGSVLGGQLKVKFDKNKPEKYAYQAPTDASSDVIFVSSADKFINKLKTSQKLMVETEFYNEGNVIMEFDISGLKWEK